MSKRISLLLLLVSACAVEDTATTTSAVSCEPWSTSIVDATMDVGASPALAADRTGALHALYRDHSRYDLRYATRSPAGVWTTSLFADGATYPTGTVNGITVDGADGVHAIYSDYGNSTRGIWYRYKPAQGTWAPPVLIDPLSGTTVLQAAVAVDLTGRVHVSYRDEWAGTLRYATKPATGTTFSRQTLAAKSTGSYSAIVADAAGGLHVTYFDITKWQLQYLSKRPGGTWAAPVVLDATKDVGRATSLAVDAAGTVHVAYTFRDAHELRYVRRTAAGWSTPVVAQAGSGEAARLVVEDDGSIAIAYSDNDRRALSYTRLPAGAAAFERITLDDHAGTLGIQLAHAGAGGRSHVIYYDRINNDLKYASGTCTE
jgi:hypothetical protein